MYGREELKVYNWYDEIDDSVQTLNKDEADKVMDAMEQHIKELEAAEYKWFNLVRDFVTVLGNDPYMVWTAIDSRLKLMCDADELERWNELNQTILDRIKVLKPHEWNRTYHNAEVSND